MKCRNSKKLLTSQETDRVQEILEDFKGWIYIDIEIHLITVYPVSGRDNADVFIYGLYNAGIDNYR